MLDVLREALAALQIEVDKRTAEWNELREKHSAIVEEMEAARIRMRHADTVHDTLADYLQYLKTEGAK